MRHALSLFALLVLPLSCLAGCGAEEPAKPPRGGSYRGPGQDAPEEPPRKGTPAKAAPEKPADWPSDAERRLEADHAPTPFTAEQIRSGCPSGLRATFRMTSGGKEGLQIFGFDNANETGVDFTLTQQQADGTPTGRPRTNRVEWTSLQGHADHPAKYTQIEDTVLTVPAGTYACMKYTVTQPDEGKTSVGTFWFAYELPGAPIKWVQTVDGKVVAELVLIKRTVVK